MPDKGVLFLWLCNSFARQTLMSHARVCERITRRSRFAIRRQFAEVGRYRVCLSGHNRTPIRSANPAIARKEWPVLHNCVDKGGLYFDYLKDYAKGLTFQPWLQCLRLETWNANAHNSNFAESFPWVESYPCQFLLVVAFYGSRMS